MILRIGTGMGNGEWGFDGAASPRRADPFTLSAGRHAVGADCLHAQWQFSYTTTRHSPLVDLATADDHAVNVKENGIMRAICGLTTPLRVLAALGFVLANLVHAQSVFKCIDREGRIAFQETPCASGQAETVVEIAPPPRTQPSPEYHAAKPSGESQRTRRVVTATTAMSFECRTASGALFYRHGGCPAVIGRESPKANLHASRGEKVRARRILRVEACRGLHSVGRTGREYDDVTPTYDKNLGRDPCRRY
jgi:hypothetical protein